MRAERWGIWGFSVLQVPGGDDFAQLARLAFDPAVGDALLVGDDEVPPRRARVVKRIGNRVWVQMYLPDLAESVA